eukprot:1160526-Pelagomonas_calceolata.AAC.9
MFFPYNKGLLAVAACARHCAHGCRCADRLGGEMVVQAVSVKPLAVSCEFRKLEHIYVFICTAIWSVWAYIWMFLALSALLEKLQQQAWVFIV